MIGSPARRGAAASTGGAARFAASAGDGRVSAATAASVTRAGGTPRELQRRIATVDRAVQNRITMPCPGRNACPRLRRSCVQIPVLNQLTAANSLLGTIGTFQLHPLIYDSPRRRKGG